MNSFKYRQTFLLFILATLSYGCCKLIVEQSELQIVFSNSFLDTDTVLVTHKSRASLEFQTDTFTIGEHNPLVLSKYDPSNDTIVVQIKAKGISDTLYNIKKMRHSIKEGCPGRDVELVSFSKDSTQYGPSNKIRLVY